MVGELIRPLYGTLDAALLCRIPGSAGFITGRCDCVAGGHEEDLKWLETIT